MIRVRVGWEDGAHWMHRVGPDAHLNNDTGLTEVPEFLLLQYEAWLDEGHLVWDKWLRAVDDEVYAEGLKGD